MITPETYSRVPTLSMRVTADVVYLAATTIHRGLFEKQ